MKRSLQAALPSSAMIGSTEAADTMRISPNGSRQSVAGSAETFTGAVSVTPMFGGSSAETRRMLKAAVTKVATEFGARGRGVGAVGGVEGRADVEASTDEVILDGSIDLNSGQRPRRRLTPGARLLRGWNGRTHIVDVIEGGFVFEAKVYPSLSATANRITGAHWFGPRFFGL